MQGYKSWGEIGRNNPTWTLKSQATIIVNKGGSLCMSACFTGWIWDVTVTVFQGIKILSTLEYNALLIRQDSVV